MENLPLPSFSSTISNTSSSSLNDNSPSTESRPIENTNWYDEGSIETCIHQPSPSTELRQIANEDILHEVDMNGIGDEFFLFSPRNIIDDEPSSSFSDDKHEQTESSTQTSKRNYIMDETNLNDDFTLSNEFQSSANLSPFSSTNNNNNIHTNHHSSLMITNLDDILIEDDDDDNDNNHDGNYLSNTNYRRPIQEDILYEVEHENSYSDHSQHTSSIIATDDKASIKVGANSDFLTSLKEPIESNVQQSTLIQTISQENDSKSNQSNSSTKQTINDPNTLPIYILPSINTTTTTASNKTPSLRIDTSNESYRYPWDIPTSQYSDLSSPSSYTSKIRHRHFSVGSYYDNKTTTVAIHPNHTIYILGSAPVSPLSRTPTTSSDSHYYMHHHSPTTYENVTYNALRRINPFLNTNNYISSYEYKRSPSSTRDDLYWPTTSYPQQQTTPITHTEPTSIEPQPMQTPPATSTRSVTFAQHEASSILSEMIPPSSPPLQEARVPSLVRPKTSRGRPRSPPPPPPRLSSIETDQTQNIYQEIDSISTEDEQNTAPNSDLQFIRGTIERVFDFHAESTSELTTNNDEISEDNQNDQKSVSVSSTTSKTNQYPAVEAVQRFYDHKTPPDSVKPTTNLDGNPTSNHSSTSDKLYARSHPRNIRKQELSPSKSSDTEQATSEEIDDTLNDIEDDDSQDDKLKRQATNNSSEISEENSPSHSSDNQTKLKKTSQETQTLQRQKPIVLTTQSPVGSQSTVQSYETACSNPPPLDIVTQMVIERNDSVDDGNIGEITGDMIIFYDDIEIVEHPSNLSSTESDSASSSSYSKSTQNSKPFEIPPPIPARTLKPVHLLNNQQQSPSLPHNEPIILSPSSKANRTYELEKSTIRKKFDVNSVNNILNRADYYVNPTASHRLPSARHFVGKLNSDDTSSSSRHSSTTSPKIISRPSVPSPMSKSQTLPLQPITTNGHSTNKTAQTPTKNPFATLPTRSSSAVGTNGTHRSIIADTSALVKQIQSSLSRNSLHDSHLNSPLSISTKDLRTFVSATYSPSDENMIDNDGNIHRRQHKSTNHDEQAFKRQARLSKSFHNVSEYNSIDQHPKKETSFPSRTQPSKSVENNLNQVSQNSRRHTQMPLNFPPVVASTSFGALPHSEDNARLLSMKWYTGQVSENSEICYNTPQFDHDDLLSGYINRYSNRDTQLLLSRLQASHDIRIHAALDDVRLRVTQFDASKSPEDLHVFMRYLESRLRDINNKNVGSASTTLSNRTEGQKRVSNGGTTNGYHTQHQQADTLSIKSRTSSMATGVNKETPPLSRQVGRQHLRSSGNIAGGETNGHQPQPPPRRTSQSSVNQENPAVFDDMLNTVLGLPKKGVATLPQTYSSSVQSREKSTPLTQTQMSVNTSLNNNPRRDVGRRLFESGTLKDPRLIYDGSRKNEKEEQPLETSV